MKIKYKLKNLGGNIFLVTTKDAYDLGMLFCRAQEYYESPYKEIRCKNISLLDLMSIYTKKRGEKFFTYPDDWSGFNIPDWVISKIYKTNKIQDWNKYDTTILSIHKNITSNYLTTQNSPYYLIGAINDDTETIRHELAHGLYYLQSQYKRKMNKLTQCIPDILRKKIYLYLNDTGYSISVIKDEIQAYLSTDYSNITTNLKAKERKVLDKISILYRKTLEKELQNLKIKI